MWANLLKIIAFLFFNRQWQTLKNHLRSMRHEVVDYTEDRAQLLKLDFMEETERLASGLVGLLVVFSMLIFTGLLGLMWLFSILWENPHRSLILGLAMLIPALIGGLIFYQIIRTWKRKPLFAQSLELISADWQLFRQQMAPQDSQHTAPEQKAVPETDKQ